MQTTNIFCHCVEFTICICNNYKFIKVQEKQLLPFFLILKDQLLFDSLLIPYNGLILCTAHRHVLNMQIIRQRDFNVKRVFVYINIYCIMY